MGFIPTTNNAATAAASSASDTVSTTLVDMATSLRFELNSNSSKHSFSGHGTWKQVAWLSRGRVISNGQSGFISFSLCDAEGVGVYAYRPGAIKFSKIGQAGHDQGISLDILVAEGHAQVEWSEVRLTQAQLEKVWEDFAPSYLNPPQGSFTLPGEAFAKAKSMKWDCSFSIVVDLSTAIQKNPSKVWEDKDGEVWVNSLWEFTTFSVKVGSSIPMGTPVRMLGTNLQTILEKNSTEEQDDFIILGKKKAYIAKFGAQLGTKLGNKAHRPHIEALGWDDEEVQEIALLRLAQLAAHPGCQLTLEKVQKMLEEVNPNLQLPELFEVDPQTEEVKPQAPEPSDSDEEIWN